MNRLLLSTLLASLMLQVTPASATLPTSADAYIDWSTFAIQIIDINGGTGGSLSWTFQSSDVYVDAGSSVSNNSADWSTPLSAADGVAMANADVSSLQASFSTPPASLNAYAQANRYGYFSLTANTMAIFSVEASAYIDMNDPINGDAYAWAALDADGVGPFGTDLQHGGTSKLAWAAGAGFPVTDSGKLYATFINLTNADMDGTVHAFTQVNKYGVIAVAVPEPETYALMLAGLGLVGFMARRRKA